MHNLLSSNAGASLIHIIQMNKYLRTLAEEQKYLLVSYSLSHN